MQIAGKIALVTGGAVRIGEIISRTLAKRGAKLAIHYCHSGKEASKLSQIGEIFKADLNEYAEIKKLVCAVEKKLGSIDILINNAGIFEKSPFFEMTEEDWDRHMNINLKASYLLSKLVAKSMLKKRYGKIINIVADADEKPHINYLAYSVSKAALIGLTKALGKELAPHIQVNAISLGAILPPKEMTSKQKKLVAEKTLLKRWGDPEEIANAVLFLIEGTDYATGSTVTINGGRTLV